MKTLGTWYMLLEGDKVTRNIYFICQVGKKCHENTYIWYILLEGDKMTWEYIFDMTSWDKMSWKHIYLVHLTWGGIKWHERGLDDSVWPPLREFWGSVARRKGHHSLPAKSIISSHYLFFHFLFYFSLLIGFWGSVARTKGIIMNSRRGNYDSYQTKMFEAN